MRSLELIDRFGAPHAAAIVVDGAGRVVGERGDDAFRFPLASVTKMLTAMAIFVACEEQTLSLDDPLGPSGSTVSHLLAHASGMSQHDARIALAKPGARRIYSNAGYALLGEHLAICAGMEFSEYLSSGVLEPLGMMASSCAGSAAGAGMATVGDLGRFAAELMEPTLVSRELVERATSVAFPGLSGVVPGFGRQDPCDWGLGFEIRAMKSPHWTGASNSPQSFGHFGMSGTFLLVDPVAGCALGLLTDLEFDTWAKRLWPPFCDAVFSEYRATR